MGRRRGSASVALIVLVLGLVGIGVVAVAWWPLPDVFGSGGTPAQLRPATATVVDSAPCGASTPRDLVEVTVDGRSVEVRFDGCGHRPGQKLRVRVPVDPSGEFVAQPVRMQEAGGPSGRSLRERLNWVLFTLAAVGGGGYALLLRTRPA